MQVTTVRCSECTTQFDQLYVGESAYSQGCKIQAKEKKLAASPSKPGFEPRSCEECGHLFRPAKVNQITCSIECRVERNRGRALIQQAGYRRAMSGAKLAAEIVNENSANMLTAPTLDELERRFEISCAMVMGGLQRLKAAKRLEILRENADEAHAAVQVVAQELAVLLVATRQARKGDSPSV